MNVTGMTYLPFNDTLSAARFEQDLGALQSQSGNNTDAEIKEAAHSFEAILLNMMISSMRSTLSESDLFGKGMGEDMYNDMLYMECATLAADRFQTGIGEALYRQLSRNDTHPDSENQEEESGSRNKINALC